MKKIIIFATIVFLTLSFVRVFANTLSIEAEARGINNACLLHLTQLEDYYDLDGLNITFAHPADPSITLLYTHLIKNTIMEAPFLLRRFPQIVNFVMYQ